MHKILIIHGPNLNLLGTREPDIYGSDTLAEINAFINTELSEYGLELDFFQSNHEGAIIDRLHAAIGSRDGVVINPAAYTHYSIAIRDAIAGIGLPVVEVHLSDISRREPFRRTSVIRDVCYMQISGFGKMSYVYGVEALVGWQALQEITLARGLTAPDAFLRTALHVLDEHLPKFAGLGVYALREEELLLRASAGKKKLPEEIRPGMEGGAHHLIVPLRQGKRLLGELHVLAAAQVTLQAHDRTLLEKVAGLLVEKGTVGV